MPHRRPHNRWKHLRDAICLNDGAAIEEVMQANDIDVQAVDVEFALIQAKRVGKNACELVDESRFKIAIAELISEVSGREVEADEEEWDGMFYDMVSVAAGELYGTDIVIPGAVTDDQMRYLNAEVADRISYGLRKEYVERGRGPAYILSWSNGSSEWWVYAQRQKVGSTIQLDANHILGYGKKADLDEAATKLNPLPLYTGSFEYREQQRPYAHEDMTWRDALMAARRWAETKNPAALVYINALLSGEVERRAEEYGKMGFPGTDRQSAIQTQLLYVINNLSGWRGEEARAAKAVLRSVQKGDTPAKQEDPSDEETRRRLQELVNAVALEREEIERFLASEGKDTQTWDTRELRADFEVLGFLAPFVVVRRKSDRQVGSLLFQHAPRYYWDFTPDTPSHYTDPLPSHYTAKTPEGALEAMERRLSGRFGELAEAISRMGASVSAPIMEEEEAVEEAVEEVVTGRRPRAQSKAQAIRDHIVGLGERAGRENVSTVVTALQSSFPDITERDVTNAIRTLPGGSPLGRKPTTRYFKPVIVPEPVGTFEPSTRPPPSFRGSPRTQAIRAYAFEQGQGLANISSTDIVTALRGQWPNITSQHVLEAISVDWRTAFGLPALKAAVRGGPTGPRGDQSGTSLLDRFGRQPRPERQARNSGSWSRKYFFTLTEAQHDANDAWFEDMLRSLKPTGILGVPLLGKAFNKQGVEVPWSGE